MESRMHISLYIGFNIYIYIYQGRIQDFELRGVRETNVGNFNYLH